jgi:hypothetical protein
VRRAALLLAPLALAGCGGRPPTIAGCLNARGFLVQEQASVIRGSSPRGVSFTLTLYPTARAARRADAQAGAANARLFGDAVVDFAGNPPGSPGGAPGKLSRAALTAIRRCLLRA